MPDQTHSTLEPCKVEDHTIQCTFFRCMQRPIKKMTQSIGGGDWYGCKDHYQKMQSALAVGMSGATTGSSWIITTDV